MTSADVSVPISTRTVAACNPTAVGAIVQNPDGSLVQASYDPNTKELPDGHRCRRKAVCSSAALPGSDGRRSAHRPGSKLYQQTFVDDDAQGPTSIVVVPDGTTERCRSRRGNGKSLSTPPPAAFLTSTVTPPAQIQSFSIFAVASVFVGPGPPPHLRSACGGRQPRSREPQHMGPRWPGRLWHNDRPHRGRCLRRSCRRERRNRLPDHLQRPYQTPCHRHPPRRHFHQHRTHVGKAAGSALHRIRRARLSGWIHPGPDDPVRVVHGVVDQTATSRTLFTVPGGPDRFRQPPSPTATTAGSIS